MAYDLLLRGGRIADGTGAPLRRGDVAIVDGEIVLVGEAPEPARESLDCDGLVVAPGFIDIHTHYDAQVMWNPSFDASAQHGVTTVVMGNCGFTIAPALPSNRGRLMRTLQKVEGMDLRVLETGLGYDWDFESFPEYIASVEKRRPSLNVGFLVGHTAVRLHVLGEEATRRRATADEIDRMRGLVREAVEAGALGFSTSRALQHLDHEGRPVPSRAADFEEIIALASVLADVGRGIVQISIGGDVSLPDVAELARRTGRSVSWAGLLTGRAGPGSHRRLLQESKDLAAAGAAISPQISCRPLCLDIGLRDPYVFGPLAIFSDLSRADDATRLRAFADPEFRSKFRECMRPDRQVGVLPVVVRWDAAWVSACASEPESEDRSLADLARDRGSPPTDVLLDLALASKLDLRVRVAMANDNEEEVAELLRDPHTLLGLSDAGAHADQLCDACFTTHLLGRWVREKSVLSLEDAVRRITSDPASRFGISDRGRLAVGLAADVVVFDPATVAAGRARPQRDLPGGGVRLVVDSEGIEHVVVNGHVTRRGGKETGEGGAGKLLRGGRAAGTGPR